MKISVVTPIYNAAQYVVEAVESALLQPEVSEVIVIEDGSTDDSLAVCTKLAEEHAKVHLFRHPDQKNHGYPASLNLGIRKCTNEWIAFLDADDYFLPERFAVTKAVAEKDASIEAIYEAIGFYFENDIAKQRWMNSNQAMSDLMTITKEIEPENFFREYMSNKVGFFSSDGLTLKRSVFDKTGFFDEHLRLHQDSAMNIKLAASAKMAAGSIDKPVAMMRVHGTNRTSAPRSKNQTYKNKMLCWDTAWAWSRLNLDQEKEQVVLDFLLKQTINLPRINILSSRALQKRVQLLIRLFENPALFREPLFWRYLLPGKSS